MAGTLFGRASQRTRHADGEDRVYETCVAFGGISRHWSVLPEDPPLIEPKQNATRLGFTVLLKFFQYAGSFPRAPQDVPLTVVDHVAQQVGVPTDTWAQYDWDSRTIERHRAQIRQHLGFREATVADRETLVTWLCAQILPTTRRPEHLKEAVTQRCRALCIEPPTPERLDRLIRSAVHREDTRVGTEILIGCQRRRKSSWRLYRSR